MNLEDMNHEEKIEELKRFAAPFLKTWREAGLSKEQIIDLIKRTWNKQSIASGEAPPFPETAARTS
ncbi:MAG: hypothetical protein QNK37_20605 [Acidobacteriota bacterium]|nr:hypothetical protein [Acidobacteriota bacterium]